MSNASGGKSTLTPKHFEAISLVYLLFFVLAVLTPSIVTKDYLGIRQTHLEEVLIFAMGIASLFTFTMYERQMEKRIKERDAATESAERATKELVESYQYIGSVNRQLELLKKLTNETSRSIGSSDATWKDVLQSLVANAASSVGADRACLRFMDLEKLRTEREVHFVLNRLKPISVSNKELKNTHEMGSAYAFVRSDAGEEILTVPSDRKDAAVRAYLVLVAPTGHVSEMEISLLKVFVNQADMLYRTLIVRGKQDEAATPMELVEAATAEAIGEVA